MLFLHTQREEAICLCSTFMTLGNYRQHLMQQKMLIPYSHLLGLIQKISISITFVHNIISETNKEGILVRELTSSDVCILFAKGYPFTSIESWSLKKEKNSFVKFSDAFLLIPPKVKSDIYCCWWTMLCSYHLLLFNTQLLWALKNFFRTQKMAFLTSHIASSLRVP